MLACLEALGCRMSLKVHLLHGYWDYLPQNLGDMSEEHGERFPRSIRCIHDSGLLLVPETQLKEQ